MQYLPDIIAFLFLFPNGYIFGVYLKLIIYFDEFRWIHWYSLTGIGTVAFFAIFMTVKKLKDQLYRFDHFYIMFHGLVWILVSGIFMLNGRIGTSMYFGFAGSGVIITPAYLYISLRSSKSGYRPARLSFANCIFCIGIAFGYSLFANDTTLKFNEDYELSGWILIGTCSILGLLLGINEVLQLTNGYNYKKSRDPEWNQHNILGILFMNQQTILNHYHHGTVWGQYLISKNKIKRTLFCIFLTFISRAIIFDIILLNIASKSDNLLQYWSSNLSFLALGTLFGSFLLIWFRSKIIFLIFNLIKISSLIGILIILDENQLNKTLIFFWVYYFSSGIFSSIIIQGILEITPFKYTELIFAFYYMCELCIIEITKLEFLLINENFWYLILTIGILHIFLTFICIILIHLYLPNTSSLIEIRNVLIGLRRANFNELPKIWFSNWFIHRNRKTNLSTQQEIEIQQVPDTQPELPTIQRRTISNSIEQSVPPQDYDINNNF